MRAAFREQFRDADGAPGLGELLAQLELATRVLVRRDDDAARGIEYARKLVAGDRRRRVVCRVPVGREQPLAARARRDRAGQTVADPSRVPALARGEDEVERRARPTREPRLELLDVARAGQGEHRRQRLG